MKLLVSLCLSLLATTVAADPRQFGSILYDLPSGWDKGRERDGYVILLSDLPRDRCEYCRIYMATGVPTTEDPRTWLYRNVARFIDEDDHEDIEPLTAPEATTLNGRPAALLPVKVGRYIYMLAAVQTGDQAVLLGFRGAGRDVEDMEESLGTFATDVLPFWESLEFVQPGDSGLLPEATPGDLSGIYWGVAYRVGVQLDGTTSFEPRHTQIVFFEDGHFYDGTAPQGTAGLDRTALLAAANTDFGVYEQRGMGLKLTYANGTIDTYIWDRDSWADGDLSIQQTQALADNSTISGRLTAFNYTGFAQGSGLSGGAASASSTTFYPDGTYTGSRVGTVSSNVVTTTNRRDTGGTYRIQNGLITMTPDNGDPATVSLIFRVRDSILVDDQFLDQD